MALGATRNADLAYKVGVATGLELAAMGVNVNYAPICDINTNPNNPSLGIRSFGDAVDLVSEMSAAMVKGLQETGVAATIKHFPGKGEASVDSHFEMPTVNHSRDRLASTELPPFKAAIDAGAKMVMTGHFAIPSLTERADTPSTLSRAVIDRLLRQEMDYRGLVITDALDMGAITQGAGQIIDVIAALRAGVDLLLLTKDRETQKRIRAGLDLAFRRGLLNKRQVAASIQRITSFKQSIEKPIQPDLGIVGCKQHQELAQQVANQAITLVRNGDRLLPLRLASDARIAAIMPHPKDLTPADTSSTVTPTLAKALRNYHPHVDEIIVGHLPSQQDIASLREAAIQYDLLVVGTISASIQPEQAALVHELLKTEIPTITVALRTPYDLVAYPESQTHICTYSILPPAMKALASAIWGDHDFGGQLPVAIPDYYPYGHSLSIES